jgi:AcrR family transcriptional regulator
MPRIVDHDARRRDIAKAVLRLVVREGVRGVTIRGVAQEAGWSTGIISHFVGDKQALLRAAVQEAAHHIGQVMETSGLLEQSEDRLQALLEAGMPLDGERAATCRIFFYFQAEGIVDPALGAELATYYAWWREQVELAIVHAQRAGRFAGRDATALAEQFVALAEGLGVQAMFDRRAMPPERLRSHIASLIVQIDRSQACST